VTDRGEIRTRRVGNAAGAWAGGVGRMSGAAPVALTPRRRCAVVYDPPDDLDVRGWPLVASEAQRVYFEPESGGLMMSPMDEVASLPCDAQPDDLAIAEGFERLRELAPRLVPRAVRRRWAGLRTFSADGAPVVGEDPRVRGFFWLAGQEGNGIVTSGALGPIAVDLLLDGRTDRFDADSLAPTRFR
jgi:D-arginine dehydrogenase